MPTTPRAARAQPRSTRFGGGKTGRRRIPALALLVVIPWLVFILVMFLVLVGFQDHPTLVFAAVALSTLTTSVVLGHSLRYAHSAVAVLGALCLLSIGSGSTVGWWAHASFLQEFHRIERGLEHRAVGQATSLLETVGVSIFHFTEGAFVSHHHTIGFVTGNDIHCVAPIVWVPEPPTKVQYWAVGRNCCEMRSNFDCGYARWDLSGQAGISYVPTEQMKGAVKEFQSVYHVAASPEARFVAFAGDPMVVQQRLWGGALCAACLASSISLAACFAAGILTDLVVLGKRG